jgi:hypothetical protein
LRVHLLQRSMLVRAAVALVLVTALVGVVRPVESARASAPGGVATPGRVAASAVRTADRREVPIDPGVALGVALGAAGLLGVRARRHSRVATQRPWRGDGQRGDSRGVCPSGLDGRCEEWSLATGPTRGRRGSDGVTEM